MKGSSLWRTIIRIVMLMVAACRTRVELMVGDKAPKFQTGKWIQGEPVQGFDSNHVYVVEFWATWCGPCVQSIPHLNELSEKFKDKGVIFIGQDVWDSDAAVAPFVKKMGTNMTYRVALDDKSLNKDGFMSANWWPQKVNHHGIPTAFIINRNGKIAWIGHPMGLKEGVLEQIVSGHYDLAKAAVDYQKERAEDDKLQALQEKLFEALNNRKWDDAQSALNEIDTLLPKMTNGFTSSRLQVLLGQKHFDKAYQLADAASKRYAEDNNWQNMLAWAIATSESPNPHCLALAEMMAQRAVRLSQGTNSASLDTLARVQFMIGKKPEAIATEEKALSLQSNPRERSSMEKTLASYRQDKLPNAE